MDYMRKTRIPKLQRSQLPTSEPGKVKDGNDGSCSNLTVTEEYTEVFRTKSYAELSSKVEGQLMSKFSKDRLSSSSTPILPFHVHQSDCLLEPSQQTAMDMVQNSTIHSHLMDFFNASLDAYQLCELLLHGIHRTRSNYRYIRRAIKIAKGNDHHFKEAKIAENLSSFASLSNPLSIISPQQFRNIHERFSVLLHRLISKHRKIKRKMKFAGFCKKALGCGLVTSSSVFAAALITLTVRSIGGIMGIPKVLFPCSFGVSRKTEKTGQAESRASQLKLLCIQLDAAARGVYILINQLDTMHRLIARLDNEVQHNKAVADMCMRNYKRCQEVPKEAVKELKMHEDRFLEQLDELQKHVCFCFLTINRSRRLVIEEIAASMNS